MKMIIIGAMLTISPIYADHYTSIYEDTEEMYLQTCKFDEVYFKEFTRLLHKWNKEQLKLLKIVFVSDCISMTKKELSRLESITLKESTIDKRVIANLFKSLRVIRSSSKTQIPDAKCQIPETVLEYEINILDRVYLPIVSPIVVYPPEMSPEFKW